MEGHVSIQMQSNGCQTAHNAATVLYEYIYHIDALCAELKIRSLVEFLCWDGCKPHWHHPGAVLASLRNVLDSVSRGSIAELNDSDRNILLCELSNAVTIAKIAEQKHALVCLVVNSIRTSKGQKMWDELTSRS